MKEHFRGAKMVLMVSVLEGNGKEIPWREVHYIYDPNNMYLAGTHGACIGRIDPYEQSLLADQAESSLPPQEEKEN